MKLAIAVITTAVAIAAPATASNVTNPKMPKPESHRIAPPTSLGGISIGDEPRGRGGGLGRQGAL